MMKPLVAALAAVLLIAGHAEAIPFTATPTDDVNVQDNDGNGFADTLSGEPDGFLRVFGIPPYFRAVMEFDISAIPTGASITSATVTLWDHGTTTPPYTLTLHGFSGDGVASVADANVTNAVASVANPADSGSPVFVFNVTAFLQSLVSGGDPFAGFGIRTNELGGFNGSDINSEDAEFDRPLLSVEYQAGVSEVPEPSTIGLLGLGLAGLAIRRRRAGR